MLFSAQAHNLPLADKSVHAVVTSPPYLWQRKYKGEQDVDWPAGVYAPMTGAPACIEVPAMRCPFGLEPTIEAYVWHSLLVLRELRRVLRDDGVIWWNIGDKSASDSKWGGNSGGKNSQSARGMPNRSGQSFGVADGNILAIPHRILLAAQADGWIVRNDCIWHKQTPMPESVHGTEWSYRPCTCLSRKRGKEKSKSSYLSGKAHSDHDGRDFARPVPAPNCKLCDGTGRLKELKLSKGSWRHTRAHESILMLTKQKNYFADGQIVKEKTTGGAHSRGNGLSLKATNADLENVKANSSFSKHTAEIVSLRNPRSVLTPKPTSGYAGDHFATYSVELIRPFILASVPRRCCTECGKGYAPIVESPDFSQSPKRQTYKGSGVPDERGYKTSAGEAWQDWRSKNPDVVRSYLPSCNCGHDSFVPGIVLDPFCGSGTTGIAARECLVRFIGADICFDYLNDQAMWRAEQVHSLEVINSLPLFEGANL